MKNSENLVVKAFEYFMDNSICLYKTDVDLLNDLKTNDNIEKTKEAIEEIINEYLN